MQILRTEGSCALTEAKQHVLLHHHKAAGWITLAQKEQDGSWKQYHYRAEELPSALSTWLGENAFFSQNTFYKPQRRIENIKQLRALYVDVDCHNLNFDPYWVLEKLNLEVFQVTIPTPNFTIFSGRGLVCVWLIEPVPSQALPLWKAIQNYFYKQMKYVGADKRSTDPTRVFRMAGSTNSKNGKDVIIEYKHESRYVLRELQSEYLPELTAIKPRKSIQKSKVVHLYNVSNLHYSRLLDIVKLAELRNFDLKNYRELFCFLYRYWSCCFSDDAEKALKQMLEFNSNFKEPLRKGEVEHATKSAEKAWLTRFDDTANDKALEKGYPGAGYNFKNTTIIHWLDITPEEQKHLKSIISYNEKRRRKRERDKLSFRERNGSISRTEYLHKQQEKTKDMLWQLQTVMQRHQGLSNVKLAELLAISEGYIRKLKKNLGC